MGGIHPIKGFLISKFQNSKSSEKATEVCTNLAVTVAVTVVVTVAVTVAETVAITVAVTVAVTVVVSVAATVASPSIPAIPSGDKLALPILSIAHILVLKPNINQVKPLAMISFSGSYKFAIY